MTFMRSKVGEFYIAAKPDYSEGQTNMGLHWIINVWHWVAFIIVQKSMLSKHKNHHKTKYPTLKPHSRALFSVQVQKSSTCNKTK